MRRPSPRKTLRAAHELGEYARTWRKLLNLTAEQVSQRAGISRPTLRKLEQGDPTVTLETFLNVMRALGRLEQVVESLDPYNSDLGRARADDIVNTQRVRNRSPKPSAAPASAAPEAGPDAGPGQERA